MAMETKTDVGTNDWDDVVKGLTIFLPGVIWTLELWIKKQLNALNASRSMVDMGLNVV